MDSDGEDDERLISYGTPLIKDIAQLEEVPRKKPVPVDQQIVTDEKGRRRFHGAFTGGFSAGYFNSVGTKEGWAPANFLSTRAARADKRDQNPEDFMDDEDLGAFGIAPRAIRVQKDFNEEPKEDNRKRPYESVFHKPSIPGAPPLKDFVVPARDSIGIKLLKKMGWKPGQGIGPRVTYKEKKKNKPTKTVESQPSVKTYGCSLPENFHQSDNSDSDDLEQYEGLTFAPDDVKISYFNSPKENWHGIGYIGLDKNPILGKKTDKIAVPVFDKGQKLAITGEAFGVGAFEKDDDTIYNNDDMSQYDFELHSGLDDQKEKAKSWKRDVNIGYIGKELEGFHISSKPLSAKKYYPAPALPKDFQPVHKNPKPAGLVKEDVTQHGHGQQQMSSLTRGAVMGELNPKASVFDFLKPEDKARLQNIKQSSRHDPKPEKQPVSKSSSSNVPPVKKSPAPAVKPPAPLAMPAIKRQPLGSFRPFANDEEKQKRYELFLHFRGNKNESEFSKYQPTTLTEWEKQREMEEFQRASALFKPLAHSMASRFVSSNQTLDTSSSAVEEVAPEGISKVVVAFEIKRETVEWHPDPMLCKRFNIPDPYPDSKLVGVPKKAKKDKYSVYDFFKAPEKGNNSQEDVSDIPTPEAIDEPEVAAIEAPPVNTKKLSLFDGLDEKPIPKFTIPSAEPDVEELKDESDSDDEASVTTERPPIDLFKAIFADSDSDEEELAPVQDRSAGESVEVEPTKSFTLADIIPKTVLSSSPSTSSVSQRAGTSEARMERKATGLFANLNLAPPPQMTPAASRGEADGTRRLTSVAVKHTDRNSGTSTACYGPSLPPRIKSEESEYKSSKTEQKDKHRQHKKKKKEKHRSKKHKHRRKSSEDESESEDESNIAESKLMDKQIAHKLRGLLKVKR